MGGKDSPPPQCISSSPVQSPKWDTASSSRSDRFGYKPSRIEYVPKCKSSVNIDMSLHNDQAVKQTDHRTLTRSDGSYSPIRAYMECIEPQTLKCAIVGDSGVGKTSMLMSYTVDKFPETHQPTIYDKFSSSISVYGKRITVTLCDTSGQDDFAHIRPLCYPQTDAAIICFSVVDTVSYENVKTKWAKEIRRHCPGVPIVIVGTQVDMRENMAFVKELRARGKRTVSRSDGNKLATQLKATCYVECSALTQFNVKNAFDEAIAAALELSNSSGKGTPQCATGCTIL